MSCRQPVLYSFRRCPYAMRARLAIGYSLGALQQSVEIREVVLKNKPEVLRQASVKATVPVLVLEDGRVIDESIDIMYWALSKSDADNWLRLDNAEQHRHIKQLIAQNDQVFKDWLDKYKYADRHPEHDQQYYRQQADVVLSQLEKRLSQHKYLLDDTACLADFALMPFIRQFAHVDKPWFDSKPYPKLWAWLDAMLTSELFLSVMDKYGAWQEDAETVFFPPLHG